MRTLFKLGLLVSFVMLILSCSDKIEETYLVNKPVYMPLNELRSSLKVSPAEEIIQPGKIYFKDNYIFVNEYLKGIHVINNSDPANPIVEKFIEIPGNVDMAIMGDILYVDSYVDLVSLDISDLDNITEVDRDTSVFPYIIPEFEEGLLESVDESRGVITGYKVEEVTEVLNAENRYYPHFSSWRAESNMMVDFSMAGKTQSTGATSGTGGSMARFTIFGNVLYMIDSWQLKLFDITNNENPDFIKEQEIGWNIETLFPYNNKLFIGSMTGMFIYDLSDPRNPEYISQFNHARACDPVVVEGDYAYVTLRAGTACGNASDQLDVIDISNLSAPFLVKSYPMEEPYGLGIDDTTLFVCDGDAGLKIYNASDVTKIDSNLIKTYADVNAFDVIPLGEVLVMIGVDGLYQYDYSNLDTIVELSHIPIYD